MGNKTKSGGVGFFGLLGIVFITLKLCGIINWSWWLVTLPLWIGVGLWIWTVVICIALIVVRAIYDTLFERD